MMGYILGAIVLVAVIYAVYVVVVLVALRDVLKVKASDADPSGVVWSFDQPVAWVHPDTGVMYSLRDYEVRDAALGRIPVVSDDLGERHNNKKMAI